MSSASPHRPSIPRAPDETGRPLWSVMVPTYNATHYLSDALTSALAQDQGADQMQIEVVDDCSDDAPGSVVDELAPERIGYYRQVENVGHTRNFNTCIARARGHLVHILHADDAVRDGFYWTMQQPFHDHPEIGAAFCRYISMDADGNWETIAPLEAGGRGIIEDWLDRIALGQRLQTPCMVVRRSVYEQLGGFDLRLTHSEDWEMWTRIAASFPVFYEPKPLALYRVHAWSSSAPSRRVAENVIDLRRAIQINRGVLGDRADEITSRALEITATTAIRRAGRMLRAGDVDAARAQVREALRTRRSAAVLERLVLFGIIWARHRLDRRKRRL
jgi:glycosyltransferase involved in cell wall biosynthesis